MSDDLESKIKQIAEMLSNKDDMPDGLKNMISSMMKSKADIEPVKNDSDLGTGFIQDDTVEVMLKLKKIMDNTNMKGDPKVDLLKSIKPFLKESRQQKVNNCIKFLSLSKITQYLDLMDKNG